MTITIAIPTFNRKIVVGKLLMKLNNQVDKYDFKCLVIDDGSSDGTFEYISSLGLNAKFFTIVTRENLGYSRTFLEMLRRAETDWVLVTADDDDIILDNLSYLHPQMERSDVSVIVTNYRSKDGNFTRGNRGEGLMQAMDLNHTAHAPGIAYRPSQLVSAITALESALNRGSEAGFFYPQVVISAHAIACRNAIFSPITIVEEIEELPSQLVNSTGKNYWDSDSRISQYLSFAPIYRDVRNQKYVDSKEVGSQLFKFNRRNFWALSEQVFEIQGGKSEYRFAVIRYFMGRIISDFVRWDELKICIKKSDRVSTIYRNLRQRF